MVGDSTRDTLSLRSRKHLNPLLLKGQVTGFLARSVKDPIGGVHLFPLRILLSVNRLATAELPASEKPLDILSREDLGNFLDFFPPVIDLTLTDMRSSKGFADCLIGTKGLL